MLQKHNQKNIFILSLLLVLSFIILCSCSFFKPTLFEIKEDKVRSLLTSDGYTQVDPTHYSKNSTTVQLENIDRATFDKRKTEAFSLPVTREKQDISTSSSESYIVNINGIYEQGLWYNNFSVTITSKDKDDLDTIVEKIRKEGE